MVSMLDAPLAPLALLAIRNRIKNEKLLEEASAIDSFGSIGE
jgi:hypothetical protein